MKFEFKLRTYNDNTPWEAIQIFESDFQTWEEAIKFAKLIASKLYCDVRMNEAGSYNGHYY